MCTVRLEADGAAAAGRMGATMNSWYDPRQDDWVDFDSPAVEVNADDGVVGVLLGPDGEPLREVRRSFGFVRH